MLYFAYDSDLFLSRFKVKIKGTRVFDKGWVAGYTLQVNARSHKDSSAKANLKPCEDKSQQVHGVLYKINREQKVILDRDHGLGYGFCETAIKVYRQDAEPIFAFTYIANRQFIVENLVPFTWYKDMILAGAIQQGLPQEYIETVLKQIQADVDPDMYRDVIHKKMMFKKSDSQFVA